MIDKVKEMMKRKNSSLSMIVRTQSNKKSSSNPGNPGGEGEGEEMEDSTTSRCSQNDGKGQQEEDLTLEAADMKCDKSSNGMKMRNEKHNKKDLISGLGRTDAAATATTTTTTTNSAAATNSNDNSHTASTSDDNSSVEGTTSTKSGTFSSRASSPNSIGSYSSNNSNALFEEKKKNVVSVASLLPSYMEGYVQHSHDDFFVSPYFQPQLLAQLMCEGFLPIATSKFLLPKLHKERCVIYPLQQQHQNNKPSKPHASSVIHTSKSTKKKLKKFAFSINQDFDGVVRGCHAQHGISWLYPKIVTSFKYIHELSKSSSHEQCYNTNAGNKNTTFTRTANGTKDRINNHQGRGIIAQIDTSNQSQNNDGSSRGRSTTTSQCEVKLYSIEVWNQETGELAAGELGYSIGTIYTSLTGFSAQDSAGSVQLAALGKILCLSGYEMWDLGMSLDYKTHLGATIMERMDFLRCVRDLRLKHPNEVRTGGKELKCDEKINCKEIFDMNEWIQ